MWFIESDSFDLPTNIRYHKKDTTPIKVVDYETGERKTITLGEIVTKYMKCGGYNNKDFDYIGFVENPVASVFKMSKACYEVSKYIDIVHSFDYTTGATLYNEIDRFYGVKLDRLGFIWHINGNSKCNLADFVFELFNSYKGKGNLLDYDYIAIPSSDTTRTVGWLTIYLKIEDKERLRLFLTKYATLRR